MRETSLVHEACRAAGISKTYVYKKRRDDSDFAERWQEEEERQTELLEQIAVRRAAEGSDTLMIFLLKARRPEIYRENVHHQHQHEVSGTVGLQLLDGHNPIEFQASKRRQAAAALLAGDDLQDLGSEDAIPDAEVVEP